MKITKTNIARLIETGFGFEWVPKITKAAIGIINRCGSTTEQLYLLGAAYHIEKRRNKYHGEGSGQPLPIVEHTVSYNGNFYEAVCFLEPWGGWAGGFCPGPGSCAIVPQLKFPHVNYHHDFGLFYSADNAGGNWGFQCAIEIDPRVTHKHRQEADEYRDSIVEYKVIRIDDEIHKSTSWFQLVFNRDDEILEQHLGTSKDEDDTFLF